METKMDANMIADMGTNSKNLNREMYAIMERMTRQAEELEKVITEKSLRQFPSVIWESENVTLSLEEELSSPTLDEDKNIMECDKCLWSLRENC